MALCTATGTARGADYTWSGTSALWGSTNWITTMGTTTFPGGSSGTNTAIINSGTVTFAITDTFGGAQAITSSPVIRIGTGATLASGGKFNTMWNLNLSGGTLFANGGVNSSYPAFQLAGTLLVDGTSPSTIAVGTGLNNMVNIGGVGNSTLTVNVADVTSSNAADLTIDTVLQSYNSSGLTKSGAGTLLLSASNSYTGNTRISGGTLSLGNINALAGSTLDMNAGDSGTLVFGVSGTNTYNLGGLTGARDLAMSDSVSLSVGSNGTSGTYSGVIGGAGSLTKRGAGAITLAGSNTYAGVTTVSAGTFALSGAGALATTGTVDVVGSGATFDISGANGDRTVGMLKGSANSVVALGANSLTVGDATSGTFAGAIRGMGGLKKQGGGALTLSASSSYTGSTRISNGTLVLGNVNALAGSTLDMNSGDTGTLVFGVSGTNTYILGGLIGSRDLVTSASTSLSIGGNGTSGTYSGVISGAGAFTKQGGGTLTLTGSSTYTGLTSINGGTLALSGAGSLSGSGKITVGNGGTLDLGSNSRSTTGDVTLSPGSTLQNGTLTSTGGAASLNNAFTGAITLGAGGAFVTNQRLLLANGGTGTLTIAAGSTGRITFGGDAGSLMNYISVNAGTATLTINGGTVNFNNATVGTGNGYLNVGSNNDAANGAIVVNGGNLNVGTWVKLGGTYNTLAGSSARSSLSISSGTVTVGGGSDATNNGVLFMNGGIGDTASTKTGTSTLAISAGGVLDVKQIQTGSYGSDTITFDGGTLRAGASSESFLAATTPLTVNIGDGGGTIDTGTFAITVSARLLASGTGGVTKSGSGVLTLSNSSSYTGLTTVSAGTLALSGAGALATTGTVAVLGTAATFDISGASGNRTIGMLTGTAGSVVALGANSLTIGNATSGTFAGAIGGIGGLMKQGTGGLTLAGSNTYSGATTVSAGTLEAASNALANTSSIAVNGGYLSAVNYNSTASLALNSTGSAAISGTGLSLGAVTNANTAANALDFSSTAGTITLTSLSGAGNTRFRGGVSIGGVVSQGSVTIDGVGSLGTVSGGTLALNGAAASITTLTGGQINLANSVALAVQSGTFGGSIAGIGSLRKTGADTLVLSGSNSYSGGTWVDGGTLSATSGNAFSTGAITLGGGGTLDLANLVVSNAMSGNGGTIRGGAIMGLFSGSATLSGGQTTFKAGIAAGARISVAATGTATFGDGASVNATATVVNDGLVRINRSTNAAWQLAAPIVGAGGLRVDGGYVQLSGSNTYSGLTQISGSGALLAVNGSVAGNVQVDANAALGGSGVIAGNISGSGLIGPGNSPGILTVQGQVEPTAMTSFAFEFMQQGDPIWSIGTASKNDVLQLTNVAPFANQLTATNIVNIYFEVASLAKDDTFRGGFFSNYASSTLNFASAIGAPTYQYYVLGSGSGTHDYNGTKYYTWAEYLAAHPGSGITGVTASVVTVESANFSSGTINNGQVTQFVIVPEPDTIIFAGIGIAMAGWTLWKSRRIAQMLPRHTP